MEGRGETETRADVARRLRQGGGDERPAGPTSYEIGGTDDPDWDESDPGASDPGASGQPDPDA